MHGNSCGRKPGHKRCLDKTSSSDWLFGLWPGPPQRFDAQDTTYQWVRADYWPIWGPSSYYGNKLNLNSADLAIGHSGAPGGSDGYCDQGGTYRGTKGEICGGRDNWGATDLEVWYPRTGH